MKQTPCWLTHSLEQSAGLIQMPPIKDPLLVVGADCKQGCLQFQKGSRSVVRMNQALI